MRKRIVTSIAIPSATLNTSTVEGFKAIPVQPITPAVTTSGTKLGIKEQSQIRNDLNRYSIHKAINPNAYIMLSFKPLMIKVVPSKKVTPVPVMVTLYLEVSKILLAFF